MQTTITLTVDIIEGKQVADVQTQLQAIINTMQDDNPAWLIHLQGLADCKAFKPKMYETGLKILKIQAS